MAETLDGDREAMSIIPYPSSREIVLRHNESVVVYDPASKQLVVRRESLQNKLDLPECPYCHKPLREEASSPSADQDAGTAASFTSPEYFRMLRHSLPGSETSSRPPSPRRRLTQARSGAGTPVRPTPDAEFVASSPAANPSHGINAAAFSPNYLNKFFQEVRTLGKGGKGEVFLVKHVLDGVDLGLFALKRIPVGDDHEWLRKVLIEVQLLQHLSHQNLVSYRHVWLEDAKISNFGPSVPCAFVLQQYCNRGDLHQYICGTMKTTSTAEELKERLRRRSKHQADPPQDLRSPRKLQFEEIYSFFKDITSGLDHLHAGGYIHRDLKPSNCLLHDIGHGEIRVLVSDFGEVQVANTARSSTGATGTISYCAPETLRRDASTGMFGNFTAKSDVFSLGMILYFLCFAQLPYHNADSLNEENDDVNELRAEITSWVGLEDQREKRPELPDKLYKFLRRLLSLDPSDRPTTDEILHGIKTGSGLEESAPPRARSAGHIFEEIRGNPRVSAVDTSPDGSSVPKKSTTLGRGSAPSKLRISPLRNDAQSSALPPDYLHNESVSPGGSLVLHSRHTSPTAQAAPHELRPPFHDPGPHPFQLAHSPDAARALKAVLLIVKICSVGLLCSPMAARPAASAVLVGGATLDVVLGGGVYVSLLLAALHGGVLGWALQAGVLCVPAARVWEVL